MISTTFASQSVLLLNDAPDWGSPVGVTFDLVSQFEEGLTGREARRPHAATLRAKVKFRVTVQGTDAFTFKNAIRGYQAQPVIVPLWPLAETWANRANIAATGLKVAYKADWSQFELFTTVEPGWVLSGDMVAPAFWGRLEGRELRWINATVAQFDVEFTETGSTTYALFPGSQTFQGGPNLAGYPSNPRLWPTALDWRDVPESFSVRIIREQLGFGRTPFETIYPQTNAREAEFRTVTQSSAECWKLLRFFSDHGTGKPFWTPTWHSAAVMAADLTAGATALSVQSAAGIQAGDYLAFVQGTGIAAVARTSTISGTTVNLTSAPGAFTAADTVVATLVLARFEKPRLGIEFIMGYVAQGAVSVVELPPEYSPAADETIGTTIGLLITRGYIYELAQTIAGITTTTRLTSYESDLSVNGNAYTARKIDHGSIKQSLFLDRDEIEIRSEIVAGDPLVKLATIQAEAPVRLTIKSVDVSGSSGSNDTVLFTGDIIGLAVRGSRLTAKAVSAGTVFDRIYPRFRMQVGCNHALFSTGCGLASSGFRFEGRMSNPGTAGYPFTFDLDRLVKVGGAATTYWDFTFASSVQNWVAASYGGGSVTYGWNAGGFFEATWTVAGTNEQIRYDISYPTFNDGDVARFSFRAKTTAGTKTLTARIAESPGSTDHLLQNVTIDTNWQTFMVYKRVTLAGATSLRAQLLFNNQTGTVHVDDIKFEKVTQPTMAAGYFAGGWIEFGSGSNTVRRAIINSTAVSSQSCTLTLARDPVPFPLTNDNVVVYPGCDGSKATCVDKFGNYVNFGGHPFMPATNPSLVKVSQNVGGGKK